MPKAWHYASFVVRETDASNYSSFAAAGRPSVLLRASAGLSLWRRVRGNCPYGELIFKTFLLGRKKLPRPKLNPVVGTRPPFESSHSLSGRGVYNFKTRTEEANSHQTAPALLTCAFLLFRLLGRASNFASAACTSIV
jgi:hypothetical protein